MLDELPLHGADLLPREVGHGTAAARGAPRAVVPQPLEVGRVDLDEQRHLLALAEGVSRGLRHDVGVPSKVSLLPRCPLRLNIEEVQMCHVKLQVIRFRMIKVLGLSKPTMPGVCRTENG